MQMILTPQLVNHGKADIHRMNTPRMPGGIGLCKQFKRHLPLGKEAQTAVWNMSIRRHKQKGAHLETGQAHTNDASRIAEVATSLCKSCMQEAWEN